MKHFVATAFCGLAAFGAGMALTSCGGGGGGNGGTAAIATGGLAPAAITEDMVLTPDSAELQGIVTLHADAANTCEFSVMNAAGQERRLFIGNYRYTKVAPNIAEVQMDNLRLNPIVSSGDMHFTLHGFLKFVDDTTVVFSGTETLGGSGAGENGNADVNDPFGFSWTVKGTNAAGEEVDVATGGSKNFSYTYKVDVMN